MTSLLDNTVMSNFSTVQRSDLVRDLLGNEVATTQQAFVELQTGIELGKLPACDWSWLPVLEMTSEEREIYDQLRNTFNAGEAASLAVADQREYQVLTDDLDARKTAQQMGISISGSLGILYLAVERELLTLAQADALLSQMIAAGYHSPIESLRELL
jgi:predicted nucleic acid-binding protein